MDIEIKTEPPSTFIEGFEIVDVAATQLESYVDDDDDHASESTYPSSSKRIRMHDDNSEVSAVPFANKDSNRYDEMQELLKQWELEELSDRFAVNLIDVSVLDYILEVDILELCKDLPLRYRIVLRHQLNQKSYVKPNPVPTEHPISDRKRKKAGAKNRQTAADQTSLQTSKPDQPSVAERQTQPSSSVAECDDLAEDSCKVKVTKLDCTLIELCQHYEPGSLFLREYRIENGKRKYPVDARTYIRKVVVEHFWRLRKGRITTSDFERMTQIITNELPDEEPSIWYSPRNSVHKKPKGLLYARYRAMQKWDTRFKREATKRELSYMDGLAERAKQDWNSLSKSEQETCTIAQNQLRNTSNVDSQAIVDAWKACFPLRRYEAVSGSLQLEEWHALTGYKNIHDLFSYDFYSTHLIDPKTIDDRMAHFIERYKVIYSSYKSNLDADKTLVTAVTDFVLMSTEITDHAKFLVLYSLPLMIRQINPRMKRKRKFTLEDSRNTFISLLELKDEIALTIKKRKLAAVELNETSKPFIIAIGSVTQGITEYYVALGEELIYECQTAPEALDLLMKLYTVAHLEFNSGCEATLSAIQSFFFDMHDDTVVNPLVKAFLTDLNRL